MAAMPHPEAINCLGWFAYRQVGVGEGHLPAANRGDHPAVRTPIPDAGKNPEQAADLRRCHRPPGGHLIQERCLCHVELCSGETLPQIARDVGYYLVRVDHENPVGALGYSETEHVVPLRHLAIPWPRLDMHTAAGPDPPDRLNLIRGAGRLLERAWKRRIRTIDRYQVVTEPGTGHAFAKPIDRLVVPRQDRDDPHRCFSGCTVLQELDRVRVDGDRAGADQRPEGDLVVAEGVFVRSLEADAARDPDLQRRHLTEVDRLRVREIGRASCR